MPERRLDRTRTAYAPVKPESHDGPSLWATLILILLLPVLIAIAVILYHRA